jgi:hypothetical protein
MIHGCIRSVYDTSMHQACVRHIDASGLCAYHLHPFTQVRHQHVGLEAEFAARARPRARRRRHHALHGAH